MYETRQNKESISRTISNLERKERQRNTLVDKHTGYDMRQGISKNSTAQLQVYPAPYPFKPSDDILGEVHVLDNLIPQAEGNAKQNFNNGKQTNRLNAFRMLLNPANWGYCVEDELNQLVPTDWEKQSDLNRSIPDYYKNIGGTDVYVDLTTERESAGGWHIWDKLYRAKIHKQRGGVGADITHSGKMPTLTTENFILDDAYKARHLANLLERHEGKLSYSTDFQSLKKGELKYENRAIEILLTQYVD